MPRSPRLGAGLLACLLGACASKHVEIPVPAGLAFECDSGGPLTIQFNGGGYQPESNVRALANGRPSAAAVPRSTAELSWDGGRLRMLPEWTERGLRYRSESPFDGRHYLIWTQRGEAGDPPERWTRRAGPRSAEDVRLGRRAALVAPDELEAEGVEIALCRRSGRSAVAASSPHAHDGDDGARRAEPPHRR
jgi:hypothetical protein